MSHVSGDDVVLPVRAAFQRREPITPPGPPVRWLFAAFMAAAFAAAGGLGIALGLMAGTRTWLGDDHWTAVVQAHGRIQVWSFAVVLVMGLAPEFYGRFNGQVPPRPRLRVLAAAAAGGGAMLSGVWQAFPGAGNWIAPIGASVSLGGALIFAGLMLSVRRMRPLRMDANPLFFVGGSFWLVIGGYFFLRATTNVVNGMLPFAESRAMYEVILRGFVLSIIVGVTLRALPGHAGTRPLGMRPQLAVFSLLHAGVAFWLAGSGAFASGETTWAMSTGSLLTASGVLFYTAMTGVLDPRNLRSPDRINLLVRGAWLGAVAWAGLLAWTALAPDSGDAMREGAVRHAMMLGFMAPLALAFAHIVLARFGNGRIPGVTLLTIAFLLVFGAWPLRTVAGLAFNPGELESRLLMGIAGIAVVAGMTLAAATAIRTAWALAAEERAWRKLQAASFAPAGSDASGNGRRTAQR